MDDLDVFLRNATLEATKKIAMEILSRVVLKSPVDTGRFRGNWTVSLNTPDLGITDGVDPSGGATIARGSSVITGMREPRVIYVSNNLPYAQRLEEGSSKQAPAGMVAVTLAELAVMRI
jgi:hypothetical protein